jgi:hypothetical protein
MYFLLFNESIDEFSGMPRPAKWTRKSKIFLWILKKTSKVLRWVWMYFGVYIFFALKLFKCILARRNCLPGPTNVWNATVAIAVCQRSCNVIGQAIPGSKKKIWLIPPLCEIMPFQGGDNEGYYNCLSFLNKRQLISALIVACKLHNFVRRGRDKNLSMQTYTAFDWVVLLMAVKKIAPIEIITAEHHDRWAVLADYYCYCASKIGCKVDLVLVQHGREHEETYDKFLKNSNCESLPYKLGNVTQAYLYDAEQAHIFIKNIFSSNQKSTKSMKIDFYAYKLDVYDTGLSGIVVLIVGHPLCEALQKQLFEKINNKERYQFLYKPHPTASNIKTLRNFNPGWILLEDNAKYPKIDFLVSYPSTLVDEYQQIGVKSFVHPLTQNQFDVDLIAQELNSNLSLLN